MRTRFYLPPVGNPKAVEAALRYHHDTNSGEHQQHSYEWTRTHWFLQGVRKLMVRGYNDIQTPPGNYVEQGGQRRVRIEKTLHLLQTEMGRVLGIDIGPAVERKAGITLDGIRNTAIAGAALDSFWTRINQSSLKLALAYMLVAYGTAGIGAFEVPDPGGVYGATMMLVPPWELRPLPGGVTDVDQVAGVEWSRWVPLDWLKNNFGDMLRFPSDDHDMRVIEAPAGSRIQGEFAPGMTSNMTGLGSVYSANSPRTDQQTTDTVSGDTASMKFVELREGWIYGDDYSCLRWNVMLGRHLALDLDYANENSRKALAITGNQLPMAPLHVARYLSVGSFWGRGLVDREINLNRELELAVGDLIQDARDSARTRIFMLPTSTGINLRTMQNNYSRLQVMSYSPDYAAPSLRPELLQPVPQTGQVLGQVVGLINGFMDSTSHQGPMYSGEAPGRMSSGSGVAQIRQAMETPMMPVAESLKGAMTGTWKAVLGILRKRLKSEDDLTVTRIDESLIGITFDRETGRVRLDDNPIPSPQLVNVTTRSQLPTSSAIIEEKLDKLLDKGLISPVMYRIAAFKHGLDLPILNRAEYENYTSSWLDNIILFGDGQQPGESFLNVEAVNHPIALMVTMEFMASSIYRLASPAVRAAFNEKKALHMEQMGAFPQPLENVDQFANVTPPSPQQMQLGMMGLPPSPGQSTLADIQGMS